MESMKNPHVKFDWFAFLVQFPFGFLLGAAIGFYAWGRSEWATSASMMPGVLFIGGGGLLLGLGAGFHQEEFWNSVGPGLQAYHTAVVAALAIAVLALLCYIAIAK